MNLWRKRTHVCVHPKFLRHNFSIGAPFDSALFGTRAQVYYCARCKWSFEVSGRQVVALDDSGRAMSGGESKARFDTFAGGPCPALAPLAENPFPTDRAPSATPRQSFEPRRLILSH